jgi:hypothetical protein
LRLNIKWFTKWELDKLWVLTLEYLHKEWRRQSHISKVNALDLHWSIKQPFDKLRHIGSAVDILNANDRGMRSKAHIGEAWAIEAIIIVVEDKRRKGGPFVDLQQVGQHLALVEVEDGSIADPQRWERQLGQVVKVLFQKTFGLELHVLDVHRRLRVQIALHSVDLHLLGHDYYDPRRIGEKEVNKLGIAVLIQVEHDQLKQTCLQKCGQTLFPDIVCLEVDVL